MRKLDVRGGAGAARVAHNHEVMGSNPIPAMTTEGVSRHVRVDRVNPDRLESPSFASPQGLPLGARPETLTAKGGLPRWWPLCR